MKKSINKDMIKIVISGINCTEGGILFIMKDLLKELVKYTNFEIIALVHLKSLYQEKEFEGIKFLEFKDSKSSWFKRLNYEYKEFYKLSLELKPDIWLSMHDITPNIRSKLLATYCHNPSPFYKFSFKEFFYDKKFGLFTLFYKYLYRINISKNDFVFVQQNWIKNEFEKMFHLKNLIVTKPNIEINIPKNIEFKKRDKYFSFFYPSFPRTFKNFEVICKAVEYLKKELNCEDFKVFLTINGKENKYSYNIYKKYKHIKNIEFLGLLPREKVFSYYENTDVLIFPSKLETWGLPISEFSEYDKPLLVSDLPYAKETVGNYEKVSFFNPLNPRQLAELMKSHIDNNIIYKNNYQSFTSDLIGWREFIKFLETKYEEKIR